MTEVHGSAIGWLCPSDNLVQTLPKSITHVAYRHAPVTVHLRGEVDEPDIEVVREAFVVARNIDQPIVPIYLDSYGGEVYAALGIIDEMRQFQAEGGIVATHCSTKAMSAANCILSNGSKGYRTAAPHATMMFHHANQSGSYGTTSAPEFANESKELGRLNKMTRSIMAECTNLTDEEWKNLLKDRAGNTSLFLSAERALKYGLVDAIGIPHFTADVAIDFAFAIRDPTAVVEEDEEVEAEVSSGAESEEDHSDSSGDSPPPSAKPKSIRRAHPYQRVRPRR